VTGILEVRALEKRFDEVHALRGVSVDIAAGEIVALLGPNGAGKTTLVSTVAGLLRPDAGTVRVNDIDVIAEPRLTRQFVGLAPQELAVYPTLTVAENLRYFGQLRGLTRRALRAETDRCASLLRVSHLLNRRAARLSGGEKRRVHTAIALLNAPPLALLDEPTAGVDVETRQEVLDAVRQLARSGSAVCYSTHYLTEVEALQPRVAVLSQGRIVGHGSVEELIAAHAIPEVHVLFAGVAPEMPHGLCGRRRDSAWVIESKTPRSTASDVLRALDDDDLAGIEIRHANLEQAFLSLIATDSTAGVSDGA
jgi:ABC-2 type transport system ATP-binding protein